MKEILEAPSMMLELVVEGDEPTTLGRWPWPQALPHRGDLIEHEARHYEVVAVRWTTANPHQAEVRIRAR